MKVQWWFAAGFGVGLSVSIGLACAFSPGDIFDELPSECYRRCNDALDACIGQASDCLYDCDQYDGELEDHCERGCGAAAQGCFQVWGRCGEQCLRAAEGAI